ncbi:hypothetical protein F5Y06DRAFT_305256 [Hypoxylon sp. FL0890]|nr:hypothetical protein F5Y06DRAFT_305256 [Hypoxylon sp. FL0890]
MSTTTLVGMEEPADTFSRIAIAIEPGGVTSTGLPTGDWNRDPSWLWPPPLYQPYCKLHFLKECSLYHLYENESFKRVIETRTSSTKKSSKWPTKPTRIQPARRAREKNWKDHSGASTSSRNSSPARGDGPGGFSAALEARREQLQLHLPWPVYKTRLEGRIKQVSELLQKNQHDSNILPHLSSSVSRDLFLGCRYCGFNPEVFDCEDAAPRRLAPPAPMHFIQLDDMGKGKFGEFGGLKFAIDIVNEHERVVPLEMGKLSDFVGRESTSLAKGESVEKPELTRTSRSRKRSSSESLIEQEKAPSRTPRKKSKRDDSVQ